MQGHLKGDRRGEIIRSGIRLAIFGPPNAGKSSLLNFLGKRSFPLSSIGNQLELQQLKEKLPL